jgi:sugar O-acyltransferase (sialic acid O-acetyltransferase NeuD family)
MDLIILGAGGQAKDLISNIEDFNLATKPKNRINIIGCLDDVTKLKDKSLLGYPVFDSTNIFLKPIYKKASVICAIGDPLNKLKFIDKIKKYKLNYANVIHPTVKLSHDTKIGVGVSIFANSAVSSCCVIGSHVGINYNCSINHDCIVGDFSTLCPGVNIGGKVIVEDCVFMGINSCCVNDLTLNKWCVVGAGATVIKDVGGYAIVVGTPQKIIGKRTTKKAVI